MNFSIAHAYKLEASSHARGVLYLPAFRGTESSVLRLERTYSEFVKSYGRECTAKQAKSSQAKRNASHCTKVWRHSIDYS